MNSGVRAGAAALFTGLVAAAATAAAPTTHYQRLLDDHLVVVSAPGEPLDTRFDYERLQRAADRDARLAAARAELLADTPPRMTPAGRVAWGINAYNFLVIEQVVKGLAGSDGPRPRSVFDLRIGGQGFFKAPLATVDGRAWSLDEFERAFVFAGFPKDGRGTPPAGFDARAHFAVVCGARGCPPLLPRAYRADSLDAQLAFATRNALRLPRHLRQDGGALVASKVFDWYPGDFGGTAGVTAFVREWGPQWARTALGAAPGRPITRFGDWDWEFNQAPR